MMPDEEYEELDIPFLDACAMILVLSDSPDEFMERYENADRESLSEREQILAELIDESLESTTQIPHIARGIELLPYL